MTTEPAIISSLSCTCSRDSEASATGKVCRLWSLSTINGHMKSFHAPKKLKTAKVTRIGLSTGSTICQKIRHSLAPSMRAASSRSSGIERAYWRTRKMPKMLASPGTIAPA